MTAPEGAAVELDILDDFSIQPDALKAAGFEPDEAGLRYTPKQEITLDTDKTVKVMNAIEALEDLDDVQDVYSNLEISEEALASMEEEM